MILSELRKALTPGAWIAVALVVTLIVGLVWWTFTEPGRQRAKANQAGAEAVLSKADTGAAKAAVSTITAGRVRDDKTDQQTQESRNAIMSAPGAQAGVDPAAGDAGRRAACMRQSAGSLPRCAALQRPHP